MPEDTALDSKSYYVGKYKLFLTFTDNGECHVSIFEQGHELEHQLISSHVEALEVGLKWIDHYGHEHGLS